MLHTRQSSGVPPEKVDLPPTNGQVPGPKAGFINYPEPQLGYAPPPPIPRPLEVLMRKPRPEVPYENDRNPNPSMRGALLVLAAFGYVWLDVRPHWRVLTRA